MDKTLGQPRDIFKIDKMLDINNKILVFSGIITKDPFPKTGSPSGMHINKRAVLYTTSNPVPPLPNCITPIIK